MFRRQRLRWFLIIIVWLAAIVILLELGLRLFVAALPPRLQEAAHIAMHGVPYPEPWDRAWMRNPDHYFVLKPGLVDAVQFGSPSVRFHVSTIELWEGGSIGFRTRPVDYFVDVGHPWRLFCILFHRARRLLGDAIGERDTGLGIVNLAQPGTGSHSHLLILQDFAAPLSPRLVIWQFFGNDFNDDYGLFSASGKLAPLADGMSAAGDDDGDASEIRSWLRTRSALYAVLESILPGWRRYRDPNAAKFEDRLCCDIALR